MPAYKKGATLGIEIEFTEEEWAEIYPWDEILQECENATTEYPLTITTDVQARTILLSSPTDNFLKGFYKADVQAGIVLQIQSQRSYRQGRLLPQTTVSRYDQHYQRFL